MKVSNDAPHGAATDATHESTVPASVPPPPPPAGAAQRDSIAGHPAPPPPAGAAHHDSIASYPAPAGVPAHHDSIAHSAAPPPPAGTVAGHHHSLGSGSAPTPRPCEAKPQASMPEVETFSVWQICANFPVAAHGPPSDLRCMVGSVQYYRARHDDFVKRNPGEKPPEYYLAYGEKYAHLFTEGTAQRLSPRGQAWLQKTFVSLMNAIETKRQEDPAGFAKLERNPEAFKQFAYGTHPHSYLESGLKDLPPADLFHIASTPDMRDLMNYDGLKQVLLTGEGLAEGWLHDAELAAERAAHAF